MSELYPCYAVQVKSKYELTVAMLLRLKGYDPYVPTYAVRKRWSDRYVTAHAPLLPGYVLCRFDAKHRLPVLCTEGVQGIVGHGKTPVPIDEKELQHLKTIVEAGIAVSPCRFHAGQRVRLEEGPLAGIEGIVME